MYDINDYVVYGKNGVCKIIDIRKEKFGGAEEQMYCVLEPVHSGKSTIYTPVNRNLDKFREVMSYEEVHDLIQTMPDKETIWIEDFQVRNERYNEILKDGDPKYLVRLIKTLHFHHKDLASKGKKMRMTDDKIMRESEKLLYDELAYVLEIEPDEVLPFITGELELADKTVNSTES
ncbi:MAG TPA: CarD family transcriptional regulator [Clostridiales bacterium]|nr:CarD family transcriptional regulator [Clostridiales bacterium]